MEEEGSDRVVNNMYTKKSFQEVGGNSLQLMKSLKKWRKRGKGAADMEIAI